MNDTLKIFISAVSYQSLLICQLQAYLPPISFEQPAYQSGQPIVSGSGWNLVNGTAGVTAPGQGHLGGQALRLPANPQQEALLKRDIVWDTNETTAFIDFQIKPAADPEGSFATFYVNGTQLAFQVPQAENFGEIWIYNGENGTTNMPQWVKTVGTFPLASNGLQSAEYKRITVRHDYHRNLWDLFIDGKLAAANLSFDAQRGELSEISFFGSKTGDTLIDDLAADPTNMLFPDQDKDGLPDAWELANGSNPNLYDRENIKPGTNQAFVDLYMDSLWTGGINGNTTLPPQTRIPPLTILGAHSPVTSLKGSMSVGGDGAMTYSMPIDIPKGTAGMEPKISLNYSSSAGNGIAGLGWSIGGLQSVTRGVASAAKDGFTGALNFDANDRFFFNGERLICINGTYGSQNSEYRTEIDSFARIKLMGGNQNSPASWWQVETKAGLIIELGKTTDSKMLAPGVNAPLTWDISKVSDTVGNYYTVSWADIRTADNTLLQDRRLDRISYTGTTQFAPYCHVDFLYQERPDKSFAYHQTGIRMENNLRLSSIRVRTQSTDNHSYDLGYETSYQSGRSLLKSVSKRQADGAVTNPTSFHWTGLHPAEAKWLYIPNSTLPKYNNDTYDANTADVNSVVSTNGTSIRLDGDVARYLTVPGNINIVTGTHIEFQFRGKNPDKGTYLIFDNNTTYNASGQFNIRVRPTTVPTPPFTVYRDYVYGNTDESWVTYRVNFQGDPSATYNVNNTSFSNLALIHLDDNPDNGVGYSEIRNIRIGTIAELDAGTVSPISFPEILDLPRFTTNSDTSRGMIMADLNSDGLVDLIDQKVQDWKIENTEQLPKPSATSGTVYRNIGTGFVADPSLEPNPRHALTNVGGASDTITRFDLNSVPCDINSDGRLDLFVSEIRNGGGMGTARTIRYKFMTLTGTGWSEMNDYRPNFESRTFAGNGHKTLTAKDLVDVNRDGYPDLVVETYENASITSVDATPVTLVPALARTVFLNLVHKGQGWVKADQYTPPLKMRDSNGVRLIDNGSRLLDVDGDGFQDMIAATVNFPTATAFTEYRNSLKFWPISQSNPNPSWIRPGTSAPPQEISAWWLPAAACPPAGSSGYNSSSPFAQPNPTPLDGNAPLIGLPANQDKPTGTFFMDVNGDGLTDIVRSFSRKFSNTKTCYERAHSTWFNQGRDTSATSSRWLKDTAPYGSGYNLPISLVTENVGDNQNCHQFTDLNGDGLIDIIYSRAGTKMVGPSADRPADASDPFGGTNNGAFINTGTGWVQDTAWALPDDIRLGKVQSTKQPAMIADINGDGFPDLISNILDGEQPKLWINQAKPEVIAVITDGFGTELYAEYRRLNDPTPTAGFGTRVYEKFTGTLPQGHASIIDNRLVVSRYSEPDGLGGQKWKSQRYGDLRYDQLNEASLGFGWIEALDESNGQLTRTDHSRVFPFGGSPIFTRTSVMLTAQDIAAMPPNRPGCPAFTPGRKDLSLDSATYAEIPNESGSGGTMIGGTIRRPIQTSSTKHHYDLDSTLKTATTTTQNPEDFDAYGFVKKSTVSTLDGTTVVTTNTYEHNTIGGKWHLGRLTKAIVCKFQSSQDHTTTETPCCSQTAPPTNTSTKTSTFTYNTTNGLLTSETVEPGSPQSVTTAYTHDSFGNITYTAVTADAGSTSGGQQTRGMTTTYDYRGRFVTAEVNDLGHTTSYSYHQEKALLLSTTDINGLTTWFTYDSFGTLILTDHPDGTKTGEVTGWVFSSPLPTAVQSLLSGHQVRFFRAKQSSGSPVATVYLDTLGRELVTATTILLNANSSSASRYGTVYTVKNYDRQGRTIKTTEPFLPSETVNTTTIRYDILSRAVETLRPGGLSDSVLAAGSCTLGGQPTTYTKTRNSSDQILERWEDQHGRLVRSKDPSNQETIFSYDLEGRMVSVSVGGINLLTNTFDKFGNKISVNEANSGTSTSTFNGFGEVTSSTNAKGQTTHFTFDALGRVTSVAKPEGTYTTSYSNAPGPTLGKPLSISGSGYQETFSYDHLGRAIATSKTQFGQTFTTSTVFDALGRTTASTDAGGLSVINSYDPTYSFLIRQNLAPGTYDGAGTVLWQAGTFDSKGRARTQTLAQGISHSTTYDPVFGNVTAITSTSSQWSGGTLQQKSYVWDDLGNLTSRTDHRSKRLETFSYDQLNRLSSANVSTLAGAANTTVPATQNFTYSTNGNLLTKGSTSLAYGENNSTRPHAVTTATVKGQQRLYGYDNAGYVISDSKRTYQWTSFGQLSRLEYLGVPELKDFSGNIIHSSASVTSTFDFDSSGNRARQIKERIAPNDSRVIENTLYLGSYEREYHTTKTDALAGHVHVKTVHRHNLGGGVIYTRTEGGSSPGVKLMNILTDHLGSTDVIFTSTWIGSSFANRTAEFQSFDAWGERRDATTLVNYRSTDTDPFRTSANDYDRGYTGHEQLDDSGLIQMNGRIYDPELGRFLSPDPYVQIPEYSQNFNRYSYCLNNPLNATDPSGFSFLSKIFGKIGNFIKETWRTIVVIAVVAILTLTPGGQAFAAAIASTLFPSAVAAGGFYAAAATTAVVGSISGGLNSALHGGDIEDVLRGAVVGGVQGWITGGILNGMEGIAEITGNFWDKAAHVVGHGVVGGGANVAMGGKFQDGFLSAAAAAYAGWTFLKNTTIASTIGSNGYGRTAIAGIVGGTASVIGGGKFANGAYTAAFQHLLNHELHEHMQKNAFKKIFSEATNKVRDATAGDPDSSEYAIKIGVNDKGEYVMGNMVKGRSNMISGKEILASKLPEGYSWIAVTHSHPNAVLGNLSVYSSYGLNDKGVMRKGLNTNNIQTLFSEDDVLFAYTHKVWIGVSVPGGGAQYGYVNGDYQTWKVNNPGSRDYYDMKSYVFDNFKLIK